jgi:NitT/TauT family transport system substrate-binding protein
MRETIMKPIAHKLILASCVIFSLLSLEAFSQDRPLKKINWGVTSLSAGNWIPWIAKEAKIYDKHGLDVQLILLRGSGQTSAAILGGSIFASPVTLTTMIMADLSGADFVNVAHTVAAVATKLLVRPDIKRVEDLKGKRVGITSLGSLSDFLLKHTFRKYGLDPNRDITWFMMGTPTERLQGLLAGTVDAAEASYPIDLQGEKKGYRILLDLRKEVSYPSMSVVTRRRTIVEDRDTVARMVRSHVEGIAFFKQNKEFSMRVLSKALKIADREMLENSYETYKQDFISVPYPITKGLEATYDFIAQTRPEVRNRKPEEFVDASFIAEMEKSGFIKKLYEQK